MRTERSIAVDVVNVNVNVNTNDVQVMLLYGALTPHWCGSSLLAPG